jgi:hypothetical protein
MSNPADKIERSEYAPKSTRYNQQNSPGAAEGELPRMGARPSSEMTNLLRSLEPEILALPPS